MSLPSDNYRKWHKDATLQLSALSLPSKLQGCSVFIELYAPTKRKGDLTNKAESVMDLMVDNHILEDDNWDCVHRVVLMYGGVDKKDPRVEITITTP